MPLAKLSTSRWPSGRVRVAVVVESQALGAGSAQVHPGHVMGQAVEARGRSERQQQLPVAELAASGGAGAVRAMARSASAVHGGAIVNQHQLIGVRRLEHTHIENGPDRQEHHHRRGPVRHPLALVSRLDVGRIRFGRRRREGLRDRGRSGRRGRRPPRPPQGLQTTRPRRRAPRRRHPKVHRSARSGADASVRADSRVPRPLSVSSGGWGRTGRRSVEPRRQEDRRSGRAWRP